MAWISNHKHKIKEKSTKSSRSSSKVVGLGLMDLWEFPLLIFSTIFIGDSKHALQRYRVMIKNVPCNLLNVINSSPAGQNGRHFADDIFICTFVNEKLSLVYFDMRLSLQQLLTPNFLQRLPSGERSYCNKNLVSVCTLKQNIGGPSWRSVNIKSNRNMSRSDWKCCAVCKHRLSQSKWSFST